MISWFLRIIKSYKKFLLFGKTKKAFPLAHWTSDIIFPNDLRAHSDYDLNDTDNNKAKYFNILHIKSFSELLNNFDFTG